jgi:hypothetical protein
MSVYFCLDDLIEAVLEDPDQPIRMNVFVPVRTTMPECNDQRDDASVLSSQPNILDLIELRGLHQLAGLLDEIPLYQINMELLLDTILTARHHNNLVAKALEQAFEGQALPNTLKKGDGTLRDSLDGSLMHPMLGHLDKATLAKIYVNFMRALTHGHEEFSFEKYVIGTHIDPFSELFSGVVCGETGHVRADILIGFSQRVDFDSRRHPENYVENGRSQATLMRIQEKHELLWAWLEADHYQMRRCFDIDRMLTLKGLPRIPNWTRSDIFRCLEKEAMKQVFAARLIAEDPRLSLLPTQNAIRKNIESCAQGQIDEGLQQLLGQTLTSGTPYSGSAARFYSRAIERAREAKTL